MKKILIISNTAFSIEKFREHYLCKIKKYQFTIYTPNKKVSLKKKYKNIVVKKFLSKNIYYDFKELYNIFKISKPSDIIVYSNKYQFIVCLLKKIFLFNFKVISVIAGRGSWPLGNLFQKFIYKRIMKLIINLSEFNVCINPVDLIFFKKLTNSSSKFFLLPTEGVKKKNLPKKKIKNRYNFIFFGRLIKEKGILDYIKAAKIVKIKFPKSNFFIAGPMNQSIIGQSKFDVNTFNLINNSHKYVKYTGFEENYKKIFLKVDCLIAPSFSEGAGTSVMEAMMSGLHIVAYNNPGHNYVLKGTRNQICKKNNVTNLVKSIENFINLTNTEINYIRKISYKKVINNFSTNKIANKFNKILNSTYEI